MIRGDVGVAANGDRECTMKLGAAIIDVATHDASRDVQQTRVSWTRKLEGEC